MERIMDLDTKDILVGAFVVYLGLVILMIIILINVICTNHKLKKITKEVKNYLSYIMETEEENSPIQEKHSTMKTEDRKYRKDEQESRILSTVLNEIFP